MAKENLFIPPTCATCKFWKESSGNSHIGDCENAGALHFKDSNEIALIIKKSQRSSDFNAVRTDREFGCNKHSNFLMAKAW